MNLQITKKWFMITVIIMVVVTACDNNETNDIKEPQPPQEEVGAERILQVVASMGNDEVKSRTAIDITDPNNTNPDFSKGEKFKWITGDNICALFNAQTTSTYQQVGAVKATGIDGKRADFNIPATDLPDVGTCRMFYPSSTITLEEQPSVTVTIPQSQASKDFGKYAYMYADAFNYDLTVPGSGNVIPNVSFHHLYALLRFNIWNQTNIGYTIQDITIKYSNTTMLKKQMKFTFTEPATPEYSTDYASMTWQNSNYKTENVLLDNALTPDKNEAVYDALMVVFPTAPLATGTFTISMTLYDKNMASTFIAQDLVLNCADYAFFKDTGLRKGMRTYFCLDILTDGRLKAKEASVTSWGEDTDLNDGPANVERPDEKH